MDEEHIKKLADTMIRGYLQNAAPKPSVDISLCCECNKMTDYWYSQWPKGTKIIWICKECRDKKTKENRANLETILEKMCEDKK